MSIIAPGADSKPYRDASRCLGKRRKEHIAIGVLSALVLGLLTACIYLGTGARTRDTECKGDGGTGGANQGPSGMDSNAPGSPLPPPALVSIQIVDGSAGAELFNPDSAEASWVVGLETYKFAHEAPVWNKQDGELFFASNRLTRNDGGGQKIDLRTISLSTGLSRPIKPRPDIPMPNGATPVPAGSGPFPDHPTAVVAYQGYGPRGGGLAYLNIHTGETQGIVTSFPCMDDPAATCQLNSPNDVVFNANYTGLWFSDPTKGFVQGFREGPVRPQAVYYFDLEAQELRYASRAFDDPNGMAVSPDGATVYVTDAKKEPARPERPYRVVAMDVGRDGSLAFRDEFPLIGYPDGIKVDTNGNLWISVGGSQKGRGFPGVEVLSPSGEPLALVGIVGGSANLAFGGNGFRTLMVLNEERIVAVPVAAQGALHAV